MQDNEKNKLRELTEEAITINEELLAGEKRFIKTLSSDPNATALEEANEKLSVLCRKEHLYLSAAKSLLHIINRT